MVGKLAHSDSTTTRRKKTHYFATSKANIWQAVRAAVLRLKSCPCLNRRSDCVWRDVALSDCFRETFSFTVYYCLICFALLFSTPFGLASSLYLMSRLALSYTGKCRPTVFFDALVAFSFCGWIIIRNMVNLFGVGLRCLLDFLCLIAAANSHLFVCTISVLQTLLVWNLFFVRDMYQQRIAWSIRCI